MENIIINGDLYVKIAPTIVYRNTPLTESSLSEAEMLDLLTKTIDTDVLQEILYNFSELMEEKAENGEVKRERLEEYYQNIGFYRIFATNENIFLISEFEATGMVFSFNDSFEIDNLYDAFNNNVLPNNVLDYFNINDVKEDFVSFYDFMMNASFVGYYLEPKVANMPRYKILFEHLDNYLLQNVENDNYLVVSKKYPGMNDYVFGEKCICELDKNSIYKDVFKQKTQNNRGGKSKIK